MSTERFNKIDELTSDLDDVRLTVDELQDELPADANTESLEKLRTALEQANDAAEEFGNRLHRDDDPSH